MVESKCCWHMQDRQDTVYSILISGSFATPLQRFSQSVSLPYVLSERFSLLHNTETFFVQTPTHWAGKLLPVCIFDDERRPVKLASCLIELQNRHSVYTDAALPARCGALTHNLDLFAQYLKFKLCGLDHVG